MTLAQKSIGNEACQGGKTELHLTKLKMSFKDSLKPSKQGQDMIAKETGPFGLRMGTPLHELEEQCGIINTNILGTYRLKTVPKPHSWFEQYAIHSSDVTGLAWVKGIGKTIETNGWGASIQDSFAKMQEKLVGIYGPATPLDVLLPGSIWNEPQDWMMALHKRERFLMSEWKLSAERPDGLASVTLIASSAGSDSGWISVEYTFANHDKCEQALAASEDDAL